MPPTVIPSRGTVAGAVIALPKLAIAPTAFGMVGFVLQLEPAFQLPLPVSAQSATEPVLAALLPFDTIAARTAPAQANVRATQMSGPLVNIARTAANDRLAGGGEILREAVFTIQKGRGSAGSAPWSSP